MTRFPTLVEGDCETMLAALFDKPVQKDAAKSAEFGDFMSRTARNIVAIIGCDYSTAFQLVRTFKNELLDKFASGLTGSDTSEMEL